MFIAHIFIAFVVAAIAIIIVGVRAARNRREILATFAAHNGFKFDPDASGVLQQSFTSFHLFQQGHMRKARNLMRATSPDEDLIVFDYSYTTNAGNHQHAFCQTVAAFALVGRPLAHFEVRPEHIFHKIGQALGYQDIDFSSHPEFSDRYLVRGRDEWAIRELFTEQCLTTLRSVFGLSVEGGGHWLIVYRAHRRHKVKQLVGFIAQARDIRNAFEKR